MTQNIVCSNVSKNKTNLVNSTTDLTVPVRVVKVHHILDDTGGQSQQKFWVVVWLMWQYVLCLWSPKGCGAVCGNMQGLTR